MQLEQKHVCFNNCPHGDCYDVVTGGDWSAYAKAAHFLKAPEVGRSNQFCVLVMFHRVKY